MSEGYFRGTGGVIHEMALPLAEAYADQVTKGTLVRVNDDGSRYSGEAADASEGAPVTERPAQSANKALWVGWAVHNGAELDDAEAMTKTDLIQQFGGS